MSKRQRRVKTEVNRGHYWFCGPQKHFRPLIRKLNHVAETFAIISDIGLFLAICRHQTNRSKLKLKIGYANANVIKLRYK